MTAPALTGPELTAAIALLEKAVPALAAIPPAQLVILVPLLIEGGEEVYAAIKAAVEHMKAQGWHLGYWPPGEANAKPTMLDRDGQPLEGVFA
jgi:hypothetical protein